MPANVYDQHKASFSAVSAWCVIDAKGERVASVAIKYGNRCLAYVHVFGGPMVRGYADGGGYDKASAAVLHAISKMKLADYGEESKFGEYVANAKAFQSLRDIGSDWSRQLQDAGFRVYQAV